MEILKVAIIGVITIIGDIVINWFLEKKSRLVFYITNIAMFRVPKTDQPLQLYFHSLVIRNNGRKEAQDVEICHGFPAENYNLYPNKTIRIKESERKENPIMVIDNLAPGEMVTISYLNTQPYHLQYLYQYIKSKEGLARQILVAPQPIFSKKVIYTIRALIIWGIFCLIYFLYKLIF